MAANLNLLAPASIPAADLFGLLDHMSEGVVLLDAGFRVRRINREGVRIDGRPESALVGRHILENWPEAEAYPTWPAYQRAMAERAPAQLSYLHQTATHDVWLDVRVYPFQEGLAIFCRDVTERQRTEGRLQGAERNLRDQERTLHLALESTTDLVLVLNPDWTIAVLNRNAAEHMEPEGGYALLGRNLWDIYPDLMNGPFWHAYHRCMNERVPVEVESFYEPRQRYFAARAFPVEGGGISIFYSDVTEQRRAADRLVETQGLLRALGEASSDLLYAKDRDRRIVYANPALLATLGRSEEQVVGRDETGYLGNHNEAGQIKDIDERIMSSGVAEQVEEIVTDVRIGEPRIWQSMKTPVRDPATGEVIGLVGVSRDITEARRADSELQASQKRLQELLATLDLASVFVRDFDGTIQFWSKGCERLYGWSEREAVGCVSHTLLAVIFPQPLSEIEACLLTTGEWSGDLIHKRRDGTVITVAVRKVLRRDEQGRPAAVMETVADVTALRQAQIELKRLNETLEARVQQEVAAREQAQLHLSHAQRMEALGQLAGGIAHDFNNVIQVVQGGATLLERNAENSALVRRFTSIITDAARRGASITRRLLAFARRDELRAERIDVGLLLQGLREVLHHSLGGSVSVRLDAAPDLPAVFADPGQLETVLVNLATNSRDAMPTGGTLTLSAHLGAAPSCLPEGEYLCLSVADTGDGMDAKTLERATEPFFTTKPKGQGTGLGLAMARGFAEQSGGVMTLQSEQGRGTVVSLWLPTRTGLAEEPGAEMARLSGAASGPPRNILLVDDEPLVRDVLAEQLRDHGFHVNVAESATAALEFLDGSNSVDLIISDLSMSGMDGISLIREAERRFPQVHAILLTGYAGDIDGLCVEKDRPQRFTLLRKPVSGVQLADRAAQLLAGSSR